MKRTFFFSGLVIICLLVACAGCTGTGTTSGTGASGTTTTPGAATGGTIVTSTTDVMPDNIAVTVDVGEKDYLGVIPVTFQGGLGQVNVKRIDVKLTRTDGTTQTGTLGTKKGDTFELDGTRGSGTLSGQPDRVEVWVITNAGQTYKVVDKIVPYRTRG